MTFDPSKPVQTRDGRPARIICTDRANTHPIVSLITYASGVESLDEHLPDGQARGSMRDWDLVNIPQRRPYADVLIAWAEGKDVQFRANPIASWIDWGEELAPAVGHNNNKTEWRIKP